MTIAILSILFAIGLTLALWPADEKPKKTSSTSSPPLIPVDLPEIRTAVHEAGHAIAVWCCTLVTDVSAVVVKKEGREGYVRFEKVVTETPRALWCELVISLSGVAAEAMIYKRGRSADSREDLERALVFAERIGRADAPWKTSSGPTFDFSKIYASPPSPHVVRNLETGYRMAKRILHANENRFYGLVSALITKKKLTKKDLESLLGSRKKMWVLWPFGFRFVLPDDYIDFALFQASGERRK